VEGTWIFIMSRHQLAIRELSGSMQRGSSCEGEFTHVEIGTASNSSAFGADRSSAVGSPGENQASNWSGERMSGMRSWIGCTSGQMQSEDTLRSGAVGSDHAALQVRMWVPTVGVAPLARWLSW
jgi:hypothetical protein